MVELSNENVPFLLEVKKIEMKEESCDWCRTRKMCRYFCICKEVRVVLIINILFAYLILFIIILGMVLF